MFAADIAAQSPMSPLCSRYHYANVAFLPTAEAALTRQRHFAQG